MREHTTHHDDCGCLSAKYEATIEQYKAVVKELVEAAKGYLGNGHEPTDGDVIHAADHCRQCKLEQALESARKLK